MFGETEDGVYLHHADSRFVMKGQSAYLWVSKLFPHLDGKNTVADICSGLSENHHAVVTSIVQALLDREFVRDAAPPASTSLPEQVVEHFAPQLNYIEHYADDPANRFAQFRESRVLVVGSGEVALAAAVSLLNNGLENVHLTWPDSADGTTPAELTDNAAALVDSGCPANIHVVEGSIDDISAAETNSYDVVILPGESVGAKPLLELASRPVADGPTILPLLFIGHRAVAGPLVQSDASPCWVCAALRLGANLEPTAAADLWRSATLPSFPTAGTTVSRPVARMLGNMLAFDVFRWKTEALTADTDGAVVVQDTNTLETTRNKILPHPLCPKCGARKNEPVSITGDGHPTEETSAADTLKLQSPLFGQYGGVFSAYNDSSIVQSPLKVGRIRLGPAAQFNSGVREITAFDLNTVLDARVRAFDAAALAYVDDIMSSTSAVASVAAQSTAVPSDDSVTPEQLVSWTGLPSATDTPPLWLRATSLASGAESYVPAAAVYPYAGVNDSLMFEPTSAGAGCGRTAAAATTAGLVSALAYRGLRAAARGEGPVTALGTDLFEGDPEIDFLLRSTKHFSREVTLLGLPGAAPAHAVLAVDGGGEEASPTWSVGAGLSVRTAVLDALRDVVGELQLRGTNGENGAANLGNPLLADVDPRAIRATGNAEHGSETERSATTFQGLTERLRFAGRDAFVADTTPPDLRTAGFATVRVLLPR